DSNQDEATIAEDSSVVEGGTIPEQLAKFDRFNEDTSNFATIFNVPEATLTALRRGNSARGAHLAGINYVTALYWVDRLQRAGRLRSGQVCCYLVRQPPFASWPGNCGISGQPGALVVPA